MTIEQVTWALIPMAASRLLPSFLSDLGITTTNTSVTRIPCDLGQPGNKFLYHVVLFRIEFSLW